MKTFDLIKKDLAPTLKELEQYRIRQLNKAKVGRILTIVPIVLFLSSAILMAFVSQVFLLMGVMVLSFMALGYCYNNMYLAPIEAYQQAFKSAVLERTVHYLVPAMSYDPLGQISQDAFFKSNLFDGIADEGYTGEDYFEGAVGQVEVKFSEIEAKTLAGKNAVTLFKGLFIVANMPGGLDGATTIVSKKVASTARFISTFKNFTFEKDILSEAFKEEFNVSGVNKEHSSLILTKSMQQALLELKLQFDTGIAIHFNHKEGIIYIAIPLGFRNLLDPNIRTSILGDDEILTKTYTEFDSCIDVIKKLPLHLNKDFFWDNF